jgi:hypothetical protein
MAEALRQQQESTSVPPEPLPAVEDVPSAWPGLTLDQRRLILSAATESLIIKPWVPRPSFDETRVVWTPVR